MIIRLNFHRLFIFPCANFTEFCYIFVTMYEFTKYVMLYLHFRLTNRLYGVTILLCIFIFIYNNYI